MTCVSQRSNVDQSEVQSVLGSVGVPTCCIMQLHKVQPCRFMTPEQRIQAGAVELMWLPCPGSSGADGGSPESRAAAAAVLPWALAAAVDIPPQVTASNRRGLGVCP